MFFDVHTHIIQKENPSIFSCRQNVIHNSYFSLGLHPWDSHIPIDWPTFEKEIQHPLCVAIGECGIDKLQGAAIEIQLDLFKKQLKLAEKHNLPVIIHCVKAFNELIALKKELNPSVPWIIHGFTKYNLTEVLLRSGFYLSFGKIVCDSEALEKDEILKSIPLDRVFLETDEQELFKISDIYSAFAKRIKISTLELEIAIEQNVKTVFKKWKIG
jgi:TatD DNase family protein